MRRFQTILGSLLLAGAVLAGPVAAQADVAGSENPLSLACTHPVFGSDLKVRLVGAPPHSTVVFKTDVDGYEVVLGTKTADADGRSFLTYRILDATWVGRDLTLRADVTPPAGEIDVPGGGRAAGPSAAIRSGRLDIHVLNPSLFLPCVERDGSGAIRRFDQATGDLSERGVIPGGKPGRILFNRDGSRGFVILDTDQIGVFDPGRDEWLFWFVPTGRGIVDVAATPDGSKIVVLCDGRSASGRDETANGSLWVYDIDPEVEISAEPAVVDPVNPAGSNRVLAIDDDSRLVYFKIGGSFVGEYNLETRTYKRIPIGEEYAPCTIKEIAVHDNRLVTLLTRPDGEGFIYISSRQNYAGDAIPVGWDPVLFDVFDSPAGPVAIVLHHSDGPGSDALDVVDLSTREVSRRLVARWPRGIRDVTVNDVRSHGVILYVPGGASAHEGFLLFFDRSTFELLQNVYVPVRVDAGSRLLLSRSPVVNRCYVLNRSGSLTVVDLELFRNLGARDLEAASVLPPVEYN